MINNEIKAKRVKLVNEGKGVTEMSTKEALSIANDKNLDLICVTPHLEIPTVKIGDYSKYLYDKKKKEKELKKKQKANNHEIKEVQLGCDIAEHDMNIKAKTIDRLLKEGNKVHIVIKYKGRAIKNISNGYIVMNKLLSYITIKYKVDKDVKIENNKVDMIIEERK